MKITNQNQKNYIDELILRVKANILGKEQANYRISAMVSMVPELEGHARKAIKELDKL